MNFQNRGNCSFFFVIGNINSRQSTEVDIPEPSGFHQAPQWGSKRPPVFRCWEQKFSPSQTGNPVWPANLSITLRFFRWSCVFILFLLFYILAESWIWHSTKPQKRFGPRLHGEWAAFLWRPSSRKPAGRGKIAAVTSRCNLDVASIDLAWFSDSRRICGQCFLLLTSTADNQTQTSGVWHKLAVRKRENKRRREALADWERN